MIIMTKDGDFPMNMGRHLLQVGDIVIIKNKEILITKKKYLLWRRMERVHFILIQPDLKE